MSLPPNSSFAGTPTFPPLPADSDSSGSGTSAPNDPRIPWLISKVDEGEAFLQAQPGYSKIARAIEAINTSPDEDSSALPSGPRLSKTRTNRIAKIAEDLAAMLTDIKPFWDYSVANRRFEQHAQIFGKLATFWYQRRNIDLRWSDGIKYYCVAGTTYLHQYYDSELGDMACRAEDPRNVIPHDPTDYDSLESCRGFTLKRKVPTSYIKDRYGVEVAADSDGSSKTMLSRLGQLASDIISPIHAWVKANSTSSSPSLPRIPTVWLYQTYLKDHRTNSREDLGDSFTNQPIQMGQFNEDGTPATNWSYVVEVGQPLYPHRRLIVWVGNRVVYDGPSFYWHDQFPLIKLTLNPWPWSWFGKAPVWDLLSLQDSLNGLLRVVDDNAAQVAQPGAIMDKNNVSRAQYEAFDTRRPGYKVYQNPMAGKGIQIQQPPPLPQSIWAHIEWIIKEMKETAGVVDVSEMLKLNQMPSNSTVESILQSMTPALRHRSRILEAFTRNFAMQFAYNSTQFTTLGMRVAILGPGGITQDDFDFDPGSMMPDYIHDSDYLSDGTIAPPAIARGPLPKYQRAKAFLTQFVFKVAPGSLLNAAQVEQKLIYLQLARAGWMDIFTLWEVLGVPNIGVLPDTVRTIPQRLQHQQALGLGGDINAAGRKATGQDVPRIVQKES